MKPATPNYYKITALDREGKLVAACVILNICFDGIQSRKQKSGNNEKIGN